MTDMTRKTVSLPDDLAEEIDRLKKSEEFEHKSYSEVIRQLLVRGLASEEKGA